MMPTAPANPFIRYRVRLDSYRLAQERGWTDRRFVALVERLDLAVQDVEGTGFAVTPTTNEGALAEAAGLQAGALWIKDETRNVGGSHKARHLFGVLLHHAVTTETVGELAIASCGNAALAAAVVARAADRPLRVFIPTWADPLVVARLEELGARISVCERRPGEAGDPTYLRFVEAVAGGAVPFSCQGTVTPITLDGGRTIGWELADQLIAAGIEGPVRVFVQVGGGALATSLWLGLEAASGLDLVLHPVQTEACAPLTRAWDLLNEESSDTHTQLVLIHDEPDRFMWPWEPVGTSAASGILDDVTYDWPTILEATLITGGWPTTVAEETVVEAHRLARAHTSIEADPTGTAGFAGILHNVREGSIPTNLPTVALFTGVER